MSARSFEGQNPYYAPEKCGLAIIGSIDDPNASWDFHIVAFWRDLETGTVFAQFDSGCSCPAPFENEAGTGDLFTITSAAQARDFIKGAFEWIHYPPREVSALVEKVGRVLRRRKGAA